MERKEGRKEGRRKEGSKVGRKERREEQIRLFAMSECTGKRFALLESKWVHTS